MDRLAVFIAASAVLLALAGCAGGQGEEPTPASLSSSAEASAPASSADAAVPLAASEAAAAISVNAASSTNAANEAPTLLVSSGDTRLEATLEENAATAELVALLQDGPIVLNLHEYGGFEMIGNLPQSLPTADEQMSATTGDIVLYQGSQISFFYGSNSWGYTRLGHIDGYDSDALLEALGGPGDSTVELRLRG